MWGIGLFAALLTFAMARPVVGRVDVAVFDIPAGPLARVLQLYAETSGHQVFYEQQLVEGKTSAGVSDRRPAEQALRVLLADTGLTYRFVTANTVVLLSDHEANPASPLPTELTSASGQPLEQMVVWEDIDRAATEPLASNAAIGTLTQTPLASIPLSVQVVAQDLIDQQSAFEFRDVLRNVSGVVPRNNQSQASNSEDVFVRGFRTDGIYRNGVLDRAGGKIDLSNVARVEVLKSPASSLYGLGEPAGIVNYVTKRPLASTHARLNQAIASDDFYRTTLDVGGPLDDEKSLLYRVNLSYTTSDSFRDFIEHTRFFIAPALTWRISGQTQITFDASFLRDESPFDAGVAFGVNGRPVAPISTFLEEPDEDETYTHEAFAGYDLRHAVTPDWALRHRFSAQWQRREVHATRIDEVLAGNLATRFIEDDSIDHLAFQTMLDSTLHFQIGPSEHEWLIGLDLRRDRTRSDRTRSTLGNPIEITAPVYGNPGPVTATSMRDVHYHTSWVGIYSQDQVSLFEEGRLKVLVSGRLDYVETGIDLISDALEVDRTAFDFAATGRLGVLYELHPFFSPYFNVAKSFRCYGHSLSTPMI